MKTALVLAIGLTTPLFAQSDGADEGSAVTKPAARAIRLGIEKGASNEQEPTIRARAVIIGSDGKRREFDLGEREIPDKALEGLPEDVRKRIREAMMKPRVGVVGRGVIIGPDGKRREFKLGGEDFDDEKFKGLDDEIRQQLKRMMERAATRPSAGHHGGIVIGPDGKRRSINDLPEEVRNALKKALASEKTPEPREKVAPDNDQEIRALRRQLIELQRRLERLEKAN